MGTKPLPRLEDVLNSEYEILKERVARIENEQLREVLIHARKLGLPNSELEIILQSVEKGNNIDELIRAVQFFIDDIQKALTTNLLLRFSDFIIHAPPGYDDQVKEVVNATGLYGSGQGSGNISELFNKYRSLLLPKSSSADEVSAELLKNLSSPDFVNVLAEILNHISEGVYGLKIIFMLYIAFNEAGRRTYSIVSERAYIEMLGASLEPLRESLLNISDFKS